MPQRSSTKAFLSNPDLEWDFFLAQELGWGSVAAMRAGMSNDEWVAWTVFYGIKAQRIQMAQKQ